MARVGCTVSQAKNKKLPSLLSLKETEEVTAFEHRIQWRVTMRTGRPVAVVRITAEQRLELESWSRRPKTAQALAMRARVVLLAADGNNNASIAKRLSTTAQTVSKWRKRFLWAGCDVCWMNRVQELHAS
jgi:DNA-binding NarL/FixJ family response regulator